ncbi:hypothetical protein HS961_04635 [Comamonas piscis]|uniref:Molecular chaperone n=1 Tax=Comamonas piscis TaxID=1562974 RepID=A0A7G5EDV2_9BURK|nr:hypothetical protein [Comamonas piscis]QMV72177.1 hypothetical protein HS961_04635 [Comamonas piscis]WSO34929.1 hypothetical protein VUJ63_04660 [Comamonas piscis]
MSIFTFARRALALALPLVSLLSQAAPFEMAVSPSRFELSAKNGERVGQSIDLHNLGSAATALSVRTLDWSYSEEGQITYHDELLPGSCRPWVALERRTVKVPAQTKQAFRFQVTPPADAPRGECRFMIAIEGVEPAQQTIIQGGGANLSLPVTGRIAVAVYLMLGGAEPKLEVQQIGMREMAGKRIPAITVRNSGDAHGRLDGTVDAKDAKGRDFMLAVEGTPIMPGQTRHLALVPKAEDGQTALQPSYPVKASGMLDWDKGSFKLNADFQ